MKKVLGLTAALIMSASTQAFDVEAKYNQACAACHAVGVAGAPKAFDSAAWGPRMATGIDAMVTSVTQGKGAMPPKGLCMDCSSEQFKALINFMSKAK
ncbi:c-type cytochrome [Bermanella sp. WJH001]|uniref:c-type cytochrome n=1 Tax=Bermanella sp. WJH001 TaxID=3048005 RepID=UPI0024BE349E|nr:c-type cytochrome [Bermanella sp. WJH001]MDJ1538910.1 c-type cytochrome [Bermanella sp. WJH001]